MLIPKKNRKEVYKYLFRGAYPGPSSQSSRARALIEEKVPRQHSGNLTLTAFPDLSNLAEGVIYAKKDFNLPAHPEIKEVPNLRVSSAHRNVAPAS